MAIFGFGQQDPYAEAEQAAQDRQTAFAGMKDNLPALGLIAGLSMLARNNGSRSVGQLIGQAGGDALNAYGTWRKMQDIKDRQAQLDKIAAEEREYARSQDAFRNDMALKQFGLQEAKMAQDAALARQRMGAEWARINMMKQAAAQAQRTEEEQRAYDETHKVVNGIPMVRLMREDGSFYWDTDPDKTIRDKDNNIVGYAGVDQKQADLKDVDKLSDDWYTQSKTYMDMQHSAGSLLANAKEGTKTGDLAMVFNFMKALDPRSVVREGEQMQARATGGMADQFIAYIDAIRGQGMLTPAQRAAFVRTARNMLVEESKAQEARNKWFTSKARAYNIDPSHVVQNTYAFQAKDIDDWLAKAEAQALQGTSGGRTPSRGTYVPGVTSRGGPGGNASPSASTPPPGFRIVR